MAMQTRTINSDTVQATEQIAEQIGRQLRGGEIIELTSDLGGGKTTFTRGLARGSGSNDVVSSPTFTISRVYSAPKFQIHHFDFYRLGDAGLVAHELEDLVDDPASVIVVEWSNVVEHVLPEQRLHITIAQTGDESRMLTLTYPDTLKYLVENS